MKLYVGNIPFSATEADVRDFFGETEVGKVAICLHPDTGRPRGFAFVEVEDPEDARDAIEDLHGADFGGRRAVVSEAIEKPRDGRKNFGKARRGGGRRDDRDRE